MVAAKASSIAAPAAPPTQQVRHYPGLLVKVLYGLGEVAAAVRSSLFALFGLYFYTTVMGLPGSLVSLAVGIGLVWDAIVDPIIGYVSDRVRLRWGQRHTLMFAGAATTGLAFYALFSPLQGLTTWALLTWFLVANVLGRLAGSVFAVPYHALGAELSDDYHERTAVTAIRGACGLLGALAATGLSAALLFPSVVPGQDPKLNYAGYPAMGLIFGLTMSLAGLTATVATLGWRTYAITTRAALLGPHAVRGLASAVAGALGSASFRTLLCSFALVFVGTSITTTLSLYFVTYQVGITDSGTVAALQAALYGGSLLGVPLWLRVSRRTEKRRLYLVASVSTALLLLCAYSLLGQGRVLGTGNSAPLLVGQTVAGLVTSLFWILPGSMLADVVDEDALATGHRRQGLLFGIFSFGQQAAIGLSLLLAGVLIDRFAGLVPGQGVQTAATIERIAILSSLLPAALLLAGAVTILRYSLDRRRVAVIQCALAAQRGCQQPQ